MKELWLKRIVLIGFDLMMVCLSYILAFALRLGFTFEYYYISTILRTIGIVAAVQFLCFLFFGLYRRVWRYAGAADLIAIGKAVALGTLLSLGAVFIFNRLHNIPRSVFFIYGFVLLVLLSAGRIVYLALSIRNWKAITGGAKTLIVGAGDAGTILLRAIESEKSLQISIVGLVDDDLSKQGRSIMGYPVLGGTADIIELAKTKEIEQIFVAIPSATGPQMLRIIDYCKQTGASVRVVPSLGELMSGKHQVDDLRPVRVEDLLGRHQVEINSDSIEELVKGRRIAVTGAGGSIGAELCRQLAPYKPEQLSLIDQSEFLLYSIENELRGSFPDLPFESHLADVKDIARIENLLRSCKPEIILHAAAYKHVPILEANPREAVLNNIGGTLNTARAAVNSGVKKFVFVSTDKAVKPVSILGASKRAAEIICQALQKTTSDTDFITVRFGNALGSTGSVVNLFEEQIRKGGPVTVTHADVTRYFMLVSEASKLVLLAAAIGNPGEIYILDMGDPIKIMDLAKAMIRLSGNVPGKDIKIEVTGLRPGEKLHEELLAESEQMLPTSHPKIFRVKSASPPTQFEKQIDDLISALENQDLDIVEYLREIVPEYQPFGRARVR